MDGTTIMRRPNSDVADWLPAPARERLLAQRAARDDAMATQRAAGQRAHEVRERKRRADRILVEHEDALRHGRLEIREETTRRPSLAHRAGLEDLETTDRSRMDVQRITTIKPNDELVGAKKAAVDRLGDELARAEAQRNRAAERASTLGHLDRSIETYLRDECGDVPIKLYSGAAPELPDGDAGAVLAAAREAVERLRQDLRETIAAPVPSTEVKAAMRAQVAALAERGAPDVFGAVEAGQGIEFPTEIRQFPVAGAGVATGRFFDALPFLCWAFEDAIIAVLEVEVDRRADDDHALAADERAEREEKLKAEILAAERVEEAAVEAAQAAGFDVLRRPDADPRAVLGLADDLPEPTEN